MYGSCIEDVNHEIYGGLYAQRIFGESFEEPARANGVSGVWDSVGAGEYARDRGALNGDWCQRIVNPGGKGAVGVANRGLNRWGIAVQAGRPMDGRIYLRGDVGDAIIALQSADGARTYATQRLTVTADWRKHPFRLRPQATDSNARFAVLLEHKGTLWVDQAVLLDTDRFHRLPVRGDIASALVGEGLTFLRYGGSMVNAPEYRWKDMIGDPDLRPPYHGTWYASSTNGFGIFDFLRFCEAAGFEGAFAINDEETPSDAADLADYLAAPVTNPWGARRAADGHPAPYHPAYIEIGNEEAISDTNHANLAHYAERFRLIETAIHSRDPALKLVCAAWWRPDLPDMKTVFDAVDGKAAAWDFHFWSDEAKAGESIDRELARAEGLFKAWNPKTSLKVVVFEENGNRHDLRRALGHATTLNATRRHGDFVLADCAANCLQPWHQNDNGWDQGQIFFTPDRVWRMPPAYAHWMLSEDRLPLHVSAKAEGGLDVLASRSEDGNTVAVTVVNAADHEVSASISLSAFRVQRCRLRILAGDPGATNPPTGPPAVSPVERTLDLHSGKTIDFPAHSLTCLRFSR
jgi:alpha-L-arabinofuranosidase